MTVVVAGYNNPRSAFLLADSLLSRSGSPGGKRIVSAVRGEKLHKIDVRIGVPGFIGEAPQNWASPFYSTTIGVACAGNNTGIDLFINKLRNLLGDLRYSWVGTDYKIVEETSREAVHRTKAYYDVSINFAERHLPKLMGQAVAKWAEACLTEVLDDYFHKMSDQNVRLTNNSFSAALLVFCEVREQPVIFKLGIGQKLFNKTPLSVSTVKEVSQDDILVLGKPSWKSQILTACSTGVERGHSRYSCCVAKTSSLMSGAKAENFVGGQIKIGSLDRHGFIEGPPSAFVESFKEDVQWPNL